MSGSEFPFSALVGQDELRLALVLNAIDPLIGGVAVMGARGTGKSTAVRALAQLLPPIPAVADCPYRCPPDSAEDQCDSCRRRPPDSLPVRRVPVPVVDLPLGCTDDRLLGSLDLEAALRRGERRFAPGLLAAANRGFLYVDEVNLLDDPLVDALLDVAASGINRVEREGISLKHPARFVLVGSGNPEEGELRPQLLDRFGLYVQVAPLTDVAARTEIIRRRLAFHADPARFRARWEPQEARLAQAIEAAQRRLAARPVDADGHGWLPGELLEAIAALCCALEVVGHRGELALVRAAAALAAFCGRDAADASDAARVAPMALRHRLRRDPLEPVSASEGLAEAITHYLGKADPLDALFSERLPV